MKRSKPEQDHTTDRLDDWQKPVTLQPVGRVRSPYRERFGTPRQPVVREQVKGDKPLDGRIELMPGRGFEEGLKGLEGFSHLWVLFLMHLNDGHRLTIKPIRGTVETVGLFASRAPHRPNPIGLSCLEMGRIKGLTIHVRGLDILDGSPVLDIKPYVPYTDAFPQAASGWLTGMDLLAPDRFE